MPLNTAKSCGISSRVSGFVTCFSGRGDVQESLVGFNELQLAL